VGGEAFREAIFWGQTANRLVNSFAHQHPFWWYLPLLPVILFPWLLWFPLWRGLLQLPGYLDNTGIRFCLVWFVFVFVGFSLVSGKQLHYLLPIVPAFALVSAYLIVKQTGGESRWDNSLVGLMILFLGLLLLIAPYLSSTLRLPLWVEQISPLPALILVFCAVLLIVFRLAHLGGKLFLLSTASIMLTLCLPLSIIRAAGPAYDLHEIGQYINTLFERGESVVHFGEYHGQYQFLGRLQQPLPVIDEYTLCPWLTEYPEGKLVIYFSKHYEALSQHADYLQTYRSKHVGILDAHFMYSACTKWMVY
jgi:4-amino-4-deoxy-L-arabinose transferase-like glycosyltransferase